MFDRAITSAPLRKLYKSLFSDGVLPNPSTNMQVSAGDGMNVLIQPGFAICNGCLKLEEEQRTLAVQAADTTYDRIDTVVLRLNDNDSERICDFYIVQGVATTSPVRPELTRNESVWELGLADLFITKSSTVVSNQRITDTRYEKKRCGVISSISEFDTTTLYQQVQEDLHSFKEEEQAEFIAWFENIKNQLAEDSAGNLQIQIDAVKENMGGLRFGFTEDGEPGVIVTGEDGADTVIPFKSEDIYLDVLCHVIDGFERSTSGINSKNTSEQTVGPGKYLAVAWGTFIMDSDYKDECIYCKASLYVDKTPVTNFESDKSIFRKLGVTYRNDFTFNTSSDGVVVTMARDVYYVETAESLNLSANAYLNTNTHNGASKFELIIISLT